LIRTDGNGLDLLRSGTIRLRSDETGFDRSVSTDDDALLNEARFGRSTLDGSVQPAADLTPAAFGIRNGVNAPTGRPQILVAGDLNFGGPALFPLGRIASYELGSFWEPGP
jgi:hypothetical protein